MSAPARVLGLAALAALAGCYGGVEPEGASSAGADAGLPEVVAAPPSTTLSTVVTAANFARVLDTKAKIAQGVDVDDRVSDAKDDATCDKVDFTSPDGVVGIDNQFGTLLPVIENIVGKENVTQLLAAAIANGQLLLLVSLEGVDDVSNDPHVTVRFAAGKGAPLIATDGTYVPYQSLGVDTTTAPESTLDGKIEGGVLTAGPGEAVIPVRVLDAKFNLDMHSTHVRAKLTRDELGGGVALEGAIGGGLVITDFDAIVKSLNVDDALVSTATALIGKTADLARDDQGVCRQVSAAIQFASTPAFIVR